MINLNPLVGARRHCQPFFIIPFLLTTHGPAVLREFSEDLDSVYSLRLDRKAYGCDVRNLGRSLEAMVGIGAKEGTLAEDEQGKRSVRISPHKLTDLWYSGAIG